MGRVAPTTWLVWTKTAIGRWLLSSENLVDSHRCRVNFRDVAIAAADEEE